MVIIDGVITMYWEEFLCLICDSIIRNIASLFLGSMWMSNSSRARSGETILDWSDSMNAMSATDLSPPLWVNGSSAVGAPPRKPTYSSIPASSMSSLPSNLMKPEASAAARTALYGGSTDWIRLSMASLQTFFRV